MLRRIIAIKNTGRFRHSAHVPNPELRKYTLVGGANGFGKTTICSILRSLRDNNPDYVVGRRTLGVQALPTIELLLPNGAIRFDGANWTQAYPNLAIFDGTFVAENVHSGDTVELDQRRNLYRVMVGDVGVRLVEREGDLANQIRAKSAEILQSSIALQGHVPAGMNLNQFLDLPPDPEIDAKIAAQERAVQAIQQSAQVIARAPLREYEVRELPNGLEPLLARTLDDVSADAEAIVSAHLAAHGMDDDGANWISSGLVHDGHTCPFCGQDIRGLPLIAAYRAIFSDQYRALQYEIATMSQAVAELLGEAYIGQIRLQVEQNRAAIEFWERFCELPKQLDLAIDDLAHVVRAIRTAAEHLLGAKQNRPLDAIAAGEEFQVADAAYRALLVQMREASVAIQAANAVIAATKAQIGAANVQAATAELSRLIAIRRRHTDPVLAMCNRHNHLLSEKQALELLKDEVRAELENHTAAVLRPYQDRINYFLDAFNAEFQITEVRHAYPGGTVASIYSLVVNQTAIDVGDGRTPVNTASFKNTLSAGDRNTLALAFFLAYVESDPLLAQKVVVFDDPFSSHDSFRRRQTIHELMKIARNCGQLIVLSHDLPFLKEVWDKAPAAERVAIKLDGTLVQGSKIMQCDLELLCRGRRATDLDDLQAYFTAGAGEALDVIRKMRVVLETYCWSTFPASFVADHDWLGTILEKIRHGGPAHPAVALYEAMDRINGYTARYAHGENVDDAVPDQIDGRELAGFVKMTLRLVNALQA